MTRASEQLLAKLHNAVAEDLLDKIEKGTATPAEISTAVKFLKDNGIEAIVQPDSPMDHLARLALPDLPDDLPENLSIN